MNTKLSNVTALRRHGAIFTLLMMALLAGACTPILDVDFNGFVAADLNGPLPGPPNGDSMSSAGNVNVTGVEDAMNFFFAPGFTLPATASFDVGGLPHDTTDYYVSFTGLRIDTVSTPTLFTLRSDNGLTAARLRLVNGDVDLFSGLGWETLGTYDIGLEHQVWIRLNEVSQEIYVSFSQEGLPTLEANGRPYADPGFGELQSMLVEVGNLFSTEGTQYWLDDLLIQYRNPE